MIPSCLSVHLLQSYEMHALGNWWKRTFHVSVSGRFFSFAYSQITGSRHPILNWSSRRLTIGPFDLWGSSGHVFFILKCAISLVVCPGYQLVFNISILGQISDFSERICGSLGVRPLRLGRPGVLFHCHLPTMSTIWWLTNTTWTETVFSTRTGRKLEQEQWNRSILSYWGG